MVEYVMIDNPSADKAIETKLTARQEQFPGAPQTQQEIVQNIIKFEISRVFATRLETKN